jgi:hypothetical protein
LKSKFELNQIKNIGVIHLNFFQKVVSAILNLFSGKILLKNNQKVLFPLKFLSFLAPESGSGFPIRIRIRIHKVSESGSGSTTLMKCIWSEAELGQKPLEASLEYSISAVPNSGE